MMKKQEPWAEQESECLPLNKRPVFFSTGLLLRVKRIRKTGQV